MLILHSNSRRFAFLSVQWLKLTSDDVKEQIFKLAKKGLTPSQIGTFPNDGVCVRSVKGSRRNVRLSISIAVLTDRVNDVSRCCVLKETNRQKSDNFLKKILFNFFKNDIFDSSWTVKRNGVLFDI